MFLTTVTGGSVEQIVNVQAERVTIRVGSRRARRRGGGTGSLPFFRPLVSLVRGLPDYDTNASAHQIEEIERRFLKVQAEPAVGLKIASLLVEPLTGIHDWRVRRSFALCLGRVLDEHARLEPLPASAIDALLDKAADWADRDVVLAIASTASARAAESVGRPVLDDLVGSPHPQARWQVVRRLSLPMLLDTTPEIIRSPAIVEDGWARRRFIVSALLAGDSKLLPDDVAVRVIRNGVGVEYQREGVEWLASLVVWSDARSSMPLREMLLSPLMHEVDNVLQERSKLGALPSDRTDPDNPHALRTRLEMASLDADRSAASSKRRQGTGARDAGYGRYGTPHQAVGSVLSTSTVAAQAETLQALALSHDEGVRWAAASSLTLADVEQAPERFLPTLTVLLSDASPWVVRESLTSLSTMPLPLQQTFLRPVAAAATLGFANARDAGWPDAEVAGAFGAFLNAVPEAGAFVTITPR